MKIPVIINNFNLLTWPKAMLAKVLTYNDVGDVIIIDNGSTYEPLLDWYGTFPCEILKYPNLGNQAPWLIDLLNSRFKDQYYVVTDSDLGIESTPPDTLQYLLSKEQELKLGKIGLALDWAAVPPTGVCYNHCHTYEKNRFLKSRVVSDIHVDTVLDTTFALYSQRHYTVGGGCAEFPYIARHYMWEMNNDQLAENEELMYYYNHASHVFSTKQFYNIGN